MAEDLRNYPNSMETNVAKDASGDYNVTLTHYSFGAKVSERSQKFPVSGGSTDPFPSITGKYQAAHPTTYNTDTSVQGTPLTIPDSDFREYFTNCVSLTSIDLTTVFILPTSSDPYYPIVHDFDHAFAGCQALTTVNLGDTVGPWDEGHPGSDAPYWESMFEGCSNLTTITGTIDMSNLYEFAYTKDMFKGCTNLQSVTIKVTGGLANLNLMDTNITAYDGNTYNYAYEILGLTAQQMANAVTLI